MDLLLDFHDSEVASVQAEAGGGLRIAFSAAHVRRTDAGAGPGGEEGYARTLEMQLAGAGETGPLADCVGRLSGGRLSVDGEPLRRLPLPFAAEGPVKLELSFHNGALLSVSAVSLVCRFTGDPRFMESYAC